MSRKTRLLIALAVLGTTAHAANGQPILSISAGATVPLGDYGKYAKTGWMGSAGVLVPLSTSALRVGGHLLYGGNSHSDVDGDKTTLLGVLGSVVYRLGDVTKPGLYLMGNVGMLQHKYASDLFPAAEGSSSGVAFGGGAGFSIPMGRLNVHGSAGFLTASIDGESTAFVPIQAGVSIPLGTRR
jgi:hypothetical protein